MLNIEGFLTTERQQQLAEIGNGGAPASALRLAIRETIDALDNGEPSPAVELVGMPRQVGAHICESYLTDDRQSELIAVCEKGLSLQAVRQTVREAVTAWQTGIPAPAIMAATVH